MSAKILVVEDEKGLLERLGYALRQGGYETMVASSGEEALNLARTQSPDLVLLDISLPQLNDLELYRVLRHTLTIPVIVLATTTEVSGKSVRPESGADDYVLKPFTTRGLLGRIRATLRRAKASAKARHSGQPNPIRVNDIELDLVGRQILLNGSALSLKPKEFELLAFLVQNPGIAFSRNTFLERVWGYEYAGGTRTVDVHMRWLRQKIEADPSHPRRIVTVRGIGYKFEG